MAHQGAGGKASRLGAFAPLGVAAFRNIWTASLLTNFGQLVLGVGAAWEMTRLTSSPSMVALVQSAMMLPLMLVAIPAGAIADMFDRRKVAMTGLALATGAATLLTIMAFAGMTSPWMLLGFCSLIGVGVALYAPSWQASIGELVPQPMLPPAVALGTISYNVARSVGPALGGLIVLAAGAQAAFGINAILYLPLLLAFFFWKREHTPSRLPPERIARAIISGARFVRHSTHVRTVLVRAFAFGLTSASAAALAPLVAQDLLGGDAGVFGLLLTSTGVGAVLGALLVSEVRDRISTESAVRINALVSGLAIAVVGLSHSLPLTLVALFASGAASILTIALLNVTIQLSVPRWVMARALSLYTSFLTGGIALGAWIWGEVAAQGGVGFALVASGIVCAATALLGFLMRLSDRREMEVDNEVIAIGHEPQVGLALTPRSGPVVIEIDYNVDPEQARAFYQAMLPIQKLRQRNGGFDWSLSRDIADPAMWTERYQCPTWSDYLRMRDRWTQADLDVQERVEAFHRGTERDRVRRRLERPFGSVRWRADTPDLKQDTVGIYPP